MWAVIALTMVTTLSVGCSNSNDEGKPDPVICPVEPPTSLELTRAEQEMVGNSNDFAFRLFSKLIINYGFTGEGGCMPPVGWDSEMPYKSHILSPISITFALGMLNNGADGETQAEINKVLGFSKTGAAGINDFCYKMLAKAATLDEKTKVMIANNIYMNKGYELLPDFVARAKAFYDAEPETRDFYDGKTRDVINKWGSDHTEGMIKETLKEDEFDPSFVSYLLNAIYFKGTWQWKFDKNETQEEAFTRTDGGMGTTYLPMMHQTAELDYTETNDFQALRLPYGNGAYQMTILLPCEGKKIINLTSAMTAQTWKQLQQQMEGTTVDVKLPRFESDTDVNLIPIMKELGMTRAFDAVLAEFPYFCPVQTYIGLMKQVAKIKLDEEGTEASAVTVIGMDKRMPTTPEYVTFHANRPFLYVISEQSTGAIFFIGQYTGLP